MEHTAVLRWSNGHANKCSCTIACCSLQTTGAVGCCKLILLCSAGEPDARCHIPAEWRHNRAARHSAGAACACPRSPCPQSRSCTVVFTVFTGRVHSAILSNGMPAVGPSQQDFSVKRIVPSTTTGGAGPGSWDGLCILQSQHAVNDTICEAARLPGRQQQPPSSARPTRQACLQPPTFALPHHTSPARTPAGHGLVAAVNASCACCVQVHTATNDGDLLVHHRAGNIVGDMASYDAFTLGGPTSVRVMTPLCSARRCLSTDCKSGWCALWWCASVGRQKLPTSTGRDVWASQTHLLPSAYPPHLAFGSLSTLQ